MASHQAGGKLPSELLIKQLANVHAKTGKLNGKLNASYLAFASQTFSTIVCFCGL